MGLNYSYVLLIQRGEESRLRTFLSQVGAIEPLPAPVGTCITLTFPLDPVLLQYLKQAIRKRDGASWKRAFCFRKSAYRDYFPTDTTGQLHGIDLAFQPLAASDYVFVSFTAPTSTMSRLFQHSPSIRRWFEQLSSVLSAKAAFLDLEAQGYDFLYHQGQFVTAIFPEQVSVSIAATTEQQICRAYNALFLL
ncbi:hypothetical protein [Hymenobacter crusticola]|uniref:Uncharacterized protein n=1 Tax=Hymenobacter crusticola TaxID=1770526 RepID=A0A243W5J0_9BACT|nr:hypothetical protein [Hymenobacter crusticola]OUJ68777.1 hypothetical protein BXP70_27475 [Hymenobacter crusticola]